MNWKTITFALVAVLMTAGCNRGGSGNVAIVNGEAITMEEFSSYLQRKPLVQVITAQGAVEAQVASPLGFQALRDLVNRRVLSQLAKDDGVFPTSAEVEAELKFQTKRRPNFVKDLTEAGMTLAMIKSDLTLDLCRERVLSKGITVTEAEVDKFIKDNPREFEEPALADLYWIILTDANRRAEVDRQLTAGQPFSLVATRFSTQADVRTTQGRYPERRINAMPDRLRQIVNRTNSGDVTAWLQDGRNWVKFYVEKKTPAKKITVDETIRTVVKRQLAMQRGAQANDLAKRMRDKLKGSTISIELNNLRDLWKKAFDSLQNEDATKTGTGTGTATRAGTGN